MSDSNHGGIQMVESVPCPLCGVPSAEPYRYENIFFQGRILRLGLNRCACGMQYISPRLCLQGLGLLYNESYITETVSGKYNTEEAVSTHEYVSFVK
jgi:hypothetical protein